MIEGTEAIVLRIHPFSNTSHVVTWLTPRRGRIATVIKGSCRPKSPFLGQYDLFYTCELLYYAHERNGLHIARECCPLHRRDVLRRNWRAAACASYVTDTLARTSTTGPHEEGLYQFASLVLDALCGEFTPPQLLHWFEISLLRLIGFGPQLWECAVCAQFLPLQQAAFFSPRQGGVLCRRCADQDGRNATRMLPDTLAILRCWDRAPALQTALNTVFTDHQLIALRNVLGVFLCYHLDVVSESRKIALEMLDSA